MQACKSCYWTSHTLHQPEAVDEAVHSLVQDADGSGRGPEKLRNLKDNSNYFRAALLRMGLTVLGDWDSPVMVRLPAVMDS